MKRQILLLVFFVIFILPLASEAQKLPNIQETSLRAPAGMKVDGKAIEWNNQFQAYNKATEVFYTLSNDNDKLYLTIQATDLDIANKIICNGITLTINGSGKMKDQGGIAITYPALSESIFPHNQFGVLISPPLNLDRPRSSQVDSFMLAHNKELANIAKDIKVIGIKEITTSFISIYNPEGIKATTLFNNKTALTYELAVPLRYLGLDIKGAGSFVYNIKLTGMNPDMSNPGAVATANRTLRNEIRSGITSVIVKDNSITWGGPTAERMMNLISPTDFWGEYTLAK